MHACGNFLFVGTRGPLHTAGGTQKRGQDHNLQLGLSLDRLCLILDLRRGQGLEAMRGSQFTPFVCLLKLHVL
jgi:hypothetical protein